MRLQRTPATLLLAALSLLALIAALVWLNTRLVQAYPGGAEFMVGWRALQVALAGDSPYPAVTAFRLPLFALLFYWPLTLLPDVATARIAWMTLAELSLLGGMLLALPVIGWRPGALRLSLFVAYGLFGLHSVAAVLAGSIQPLAVLAVALAFFAMHRGREQAAGILLALALLLPDLALPVAIPAFIWAASRGRNRLLAAFGITLTVLLAAATYVDLQWFLAWLPRQFPNGLHLPQDFGGWLWALGLAFVLLREWSALAGRDFHWLLWTTSVSLSVAALAGWPHAAGVALLPALALVASLWEERWPRASLWLLLGSLMALGPGLWWAALPGGALEPPVWAASILPAFLLFWLYWMRWWALNPHRRMPIDAMKAIGRL